MKNIFNLLLTLSLLSFTSACQDGNPQEIGKLEGSVYRGVIPCADCAGIAFTVSLQDDGHYKTSSMYIGESSREFIETGLWKVKEDTLLVLNYDSREPRLLDIENNQLIMLKANGKAVTGLLAENYVLPKVDSTKREDIWKEERKEGVDFHATGNEPSWALAIDFDEHIVFHNLSGDTIKVPVPEMEVNEQTEARILKAETESGSLTVALSPVGCVDDMSGWIYDYQVTVNANGKEYSGCGDFINPGYHINEYWTLYSLNGNKIDKEKISFTVPYLQFSVAEQKVHGSTGCNLLMGSFSIEDSSISFSRVAITKRACLSENLEQLFLNTLNKVDNFELWNGELILLNQNDSLLIFRKMSY